MTAREFVQAFYEEKRGFLKMYLSDEPTTETSLLIKSLGLNNQQHEVLK